MPDLAFPFIPAVSVALVDGDHVLLVKRGRAPSKGLFAFPGGRVEPGESLEDAARRELFEETALAAGPLSLVQVLDIEREAGSAAFRLHVFTAPHLGGEPVAGDDADEARWFRLPDMTGMPVIPSVLAVAELLLAPAASGG